MSTLHPKYEPLFKHTGRYSIITGGRNSGKSYAVTDMMLKLTFEKGHKILYTRLTMESAYESIIAGVKDQIEDLGLERFFTINRTTIINKLTKSRIVFKGLKASTGEATSRLKSLAGFTTLVIEEAEEFRSEDEFDKINYSIRTTKKQLRIILLLNPASKAHWIYQRFFLDKSINPGYNGIQDDVCYVHTTYKDCYKWVPKDIRKEIEDLKVRRLERYKHIFLGEWQDKSEGVIFSDWYKGQFPTDIESAFGGDYGYKADPSTLIEVAIDKVTKKIYLKERLYKRGLTTSALAKIYQTIAGNKVIVADSAEPRLIDEIKSFGVNIKPCKKGAGSILAGITLMQDYTLVVDENSANLIKELENYEWSKKKEAPVDAFNHCIDSIRYIVTELLRPQHNGVYHFY